MDLTILTCNYNTPELIVNLLKSVKSTSSQLPNVVVMNTSEGNSDLLIENGIPHFNFRNGIHGEAVNLGFQKIKTRYVLLVDSDVIFLQDFSKAFERFKSGKFTLMGKVVGDCGVVSLHPRVEPWYCFIDLDVLKKHKIKFFDRDRHMQRHLQHVDTLYDVGSTMFEDVLRNNLTVGDVDLSGKYFKHYGGMSWHVEKFKADEKDTDVDFGGTHPNAAIYNHGLLVREMYKSEVTSLDAIDIKNVFENE